MPSSALLTEKACTAAAAAAAAHIVHVHACMHTTVRRSVVASASVGLCDSFVNLDSCVEDGFSSSLEFGYVVLGLFFPFPNSQSNWPVRLRCLIAADTDRRSHSPLPPGTMSSILFAKHVSFEQSVSSPRPVITSRREEKNNKAKVFQHPIDSHSLVSPLHPAWSARTSRPVLSESAAVQRVS